MKLRERLEAIKPLIETTEEVAELIRGGILTGSYAFGVDGPESDRDVIIQPNTLLDMGDTVYSHNGIYLHRSSEEDLEFHYNEEQFESCYVLYRRNIYNLLLMKEKRYFDAWEYATKEMIDRIQKDPILKRRIRDKQYRVELFEELKWNFDNFF
jgi:hypothetical protein